jgi:hypothetical protein
VTRWGWCLPGPHPDECLTLRRHSRIRREQRQITHQILQVEDIRADPAESTTGSAAFRATIAVDAVDIGAPNAAAIYRALIDDLTTPAQTWRAELVATVLEADEVEPVVSAVTIVEEPRLLPGAFLCPVTPPRS